MTTKELIKAIKDNEPFDNGNLCSVIYNFLTLDAEYKIMLDNEVIYSENIETGDYMFNHDIPAKIEKLITKAKFTF